jgi:hypothetical protein
VDVGVTSGGVAAATKTVGVAVSNGDIVVGEQVVAVILIILLLWWWGCNF